MTCTLFVDPGTACGFAVGFRGGMTSGEWDLRRDKHEAWAMIPIKLKRRIRETHRELQFTHVGYEKAARHLGVHAAHLAGALYAAIQEVCIELDVTFEAVPVGTLKKFWTGKGNASKRDMIEEAVKRGDAPDTDNEADAIAGWHWLQSQAEGEPADDIATIAALREAAE